MRGAVLDFVMAVTVFGVFAWTTRDGQPPSAPAPRPAIVQPDTASATADSTGLLSVRFVRHHHGFELLPKRPV